MRVPRRDAAAFLCRGARREEGEAPIEEGAVPTSDTPRRVARLQRVVSTLGTVNIAFQAAVLATTTVLAMKAGKSTKWTFISQLLP